MKKLLSLVLAILLACTATALATAAPESAIVYVTITDDAGAIALACQPVTVIDTDDDGALTIADALRCAHAENHENGLDAFGTELTEYGLSMTRLWGIENGGSYGYYHNNASVWSLMDPVAEGSYVAAFVYTDTVAWSDAYSYFDALTLTAAPGEAVQLTLLSAGWDENYMPVALPVAGAALSLDGVPTGVSTADDGSAALTVTAPGVYLISAISTEATLVPPVCLLVITE